MNVQDDAFLQDLLLWFQHDNGDACDCAMLDMLRKLLQQQGVASKLCSLGMIPALEMLRDTRSPEVQRSADRTLTALMQTSLTDAYQPVSPNQGSQLVPWSRCQSNSTVLLNPLQKQQPSTREFSTSDGSAKYGRNSRRRDNLENVSQAFGSQQGEGRHGHPSVCTQFFALLTLSRSRPQCWPVKCLPKVYNAAV